MTFLRIADPLFEFDEAPAAMMIINSTANIPRLIQNMVFTWDEDFCAPAKSWLLRLGFTRAAKTSAAIPIGQNMIREATAMTQCGRMADGPAGCGIGLGGRCGGGVPAPRC